MGTLTSDQNDPFSNQRARELEVRALAVQAAATLHVGFVGEGSMATRRDREDAAHRTLMTARLFEQFIEEGTWPTDPEAQA